MSFHKRSWLARQLIRWLVWPLEAAGLILLAGLLRLLPAGLASWTGGALVRLLAPLSSWQRRAEQNISHALPELAAAERTDILNRMWWHIGRTAGEYFHANQLVRSGRVEVSGLEHLTASKTGAIVVGGHFGNWEILPELARRTGRQVGLVYRPLNNQLANWIFKARQTQPGTRTFVKGRPAALGMVATVKQGGIMLILADQQLREGLSVPFFGHPAQTAVAHVKIALKRGCNLHLARTRRLANGRLRAEISAPLVINGKDYPDEEAGVLALASQINAAFESWIREDPAQWLWPHRRWGRLD